MTYPVWVGEVGQLVIVHPDDVVHVPLAWHVMEVAVPAYPDAQETLRVDPYVVPPDAMV